jgi:hypothetical protein
MTMLLTGREVEWTKVQADMRRPFYRRRGEKDGSFTWSGIIDLFVIIVVIAGIAYTGFMLGRHYESTKDNTVHIPAKEYKSFRIQGH